MRFINWNINGIKIVKRKTFIFFFLGILLLYGCRDSQGTKIEFTNYLQESQWFVDQGGLLGLDKAKVFNLIEKVDSGWSNFQAVDFLDEVKFKSYDNWECGNDCFTTTYGRYFFIEANRIKIQIDSVTRSGLCQSPTQVFSPPSVEVFKLIKDSVHLKLIRH